MDLTTYALLKQQIGNVSSFTEEDAAKLNKVIQDVEELSGQTVNKEEFAEMLKSLVDANDNDKIDTIEEIANWISGEDSRFAEKLATDPMMEDWTAGKTVDAAVLKSDFENVLATFENKANTADLVQVAFSGDYNDLINQPTIPQPTPQIQADWGQTDETAVDFIKNKPVVEEPAEYTIEYDSWFVYYPRYKFITTPDDIDAAWENFKNGNVIINRPLDLRIDPIDEIPTLELSNYKKYEEIGPRKVFYHRIVMLDISTVQMAPQKVYDDYLCVWYNGSKIQFFPYMKCRNNIDIVIDVGNNTLPYSTTVNDYTLWGKSNLAKAKASYAPYDTTNRVRLRIQDDNIYLNPCETISFNSLPRYYGESKKLGKKFVVTFNDFEDGVQPTALVEEVSETQIQSDWNQTDETAADYIKNKPQQITEQDVTNWGFTKNTGTYIKPADGIPASDLADGVIPTVPTKISDLTNDSGYQTAPFEIPINTDEQGNYNTTVSAEEIFDNADNCIINLMRQSITPMSVTKYEPIVNIGFAYGMIQYGTFISQAIFIEADKSNNSVNISVELETTNLLPKVTSSDNGKVLGVVDGAWAAQAGPAAVTEQTVAEWGFTKNTGTYNKPGDGIPKTDLAEAVQTSLGKADTALQSHQSLTAYRTASAQDTIDEAQNTEITAKYTKPSTGIPKSDLAADVQTSLGKADTALQSHQSLAGYATEAWVENKGYLTQHQDISGKADKIPRISKASTDTTATVEPNKLYVFPEMASLTITLAAITDNSIVNEYHFIFDSGATATVLTLPASVLQPDGFAVEANMHYEISILEGAMTAQGWAVTV